MMPALTVQPLARGAEANVYRARFMGQAALVKRRHKKAYRHATLDAKLRSERTILEARVLAKAALAGVRVPRLLHVDAHAFEIVVSEIDGELLSRVLGSLPPKLLMDAAAQCGRALARLHAAGIFHGDATTSNFMLDTRGRVWLIDFGLSGFSKSAEDHATDVLLFKKSVQALSNTSRVFDSFWKSYATQNPKAKTVLATLGEIEARGRYVVRSLAGA